MRNIRNMKDREDENERRLSMTEVMKRRRMGNRLMRGAFIQGNTVNEVQEKKQYFNNNSTRSHE